jgi:hypothetical protein
MAEEEIVVEETKKWYTSKTYIGLAITVAGILLKAFGINVIPADLEGVVSALFQTVGIALAAYGRYAATKKIG